ARRAGDCPVPRQSHHRRRRVVQSSNNQLELGVDARGRILKSDDSCHLKSEIRSCRLDWGPIGDFEISDLRWAFVRFQNFSLGILSRHLLITLTLSSTLCCNCSSMRIRKSFSVFLLLLCGPAALVLFSQLSGDVAPLRQVRDRFPVFADVAVDPESNIVTVTDENLFSLRTYDRDLATNDVADPRTVVTGNRTRVDFVCG